MKFSVQNTQLSESSSKAETDLLLKQEKVPYCLMPFIQGPGMLKRLNNSHTAFPRGSHLTQITSVKYNHTHS